MSEIEFELEREVCGESRALGDAANLEQGSPSEDCASVVAASVAGASVSGGPGRSASEAGVDGDLESSSSSSTPYSTNGFKRQLLYRPGTRPEDLNDVPGISAVRRMPCLLSWARSVNRPFYEDVVGFDTLMAARLLAGVIYAVPVNAFVRHDRGCDKDDPGIDNDEDGLCGWLCTQLRGLIVPKVADERTKRALEIALEGERDTRGVAHLVELTLELPFLREFRSIGVASQTSAPVAHQGIDHDDKGLRGDDGRTFKPQSRDAVRDGARLTVVVNDPAAATEGEVEPAATITLEITTSCALLRVESGGKSVPQQLEQVEKEALNRLLMPWEWSLRDVVRTRRKFAAPSLACDALTDPARAALLAAALAGMKDVERWVVLLELSGAGMHVASQKVGAGAKDVFDLYACSEETGLWERDHCSKEYLTLLKRCHRDIHNLIHDKERTLTLLEDGVAHGLWRDEDYLVGLVSQEQLEQDAASYGEPLSDFERKQKRPSLKRARRIWLNQTDRGDRWANLSVILERHNPETCDKIRYDSERLRFAFAQRVLVPGGVIKLDVLDQVNFKDGFCYEAAIANFRRIRPQDFCSLNTGYNRPVYSKVRRDILIALLSEIHPSRPILNWRLGLKARALTAGQGNPVLLSSQGVGGGCKSLEANLTREAWGGDYGHSMNKLALDSVRGASADSASPSLMALMNKRYVSSDEVCQIDADTVKSLLGGMPLSARNLHENSQTFLLKFPVLEILSNLTHDEKDRATFKADDGMDRRLRCCHFRQKFTDAANASEARAIVQGRTAGSDGVLQQVNDDEIDTHAHAPDAAAAPGAAAAGLDAREGHETELSYWTSFDRVMFPEKFRYLLSLAPDLMLLLTELHQAATGPGGSWPAQPGEIDRWSAEAMISATSTHPLDEWMRTEYKRCKCVPINPKDPALPTTVELFDACTRKPCTHTVSCMTVIQGLRNKLMVGGRSLLEVICSQANTKRAVLGLTTKMDAVRCFAADPMKDSAWAPTVPLHKDEVC